MEQFGTVDSRFGNTREPPSTSRCKKSRAWCFTWPNPPKNFVEQLRSEFGNFNYVFQLEETSVVHVQGVMRYPNPRANWPVIANGIHWERCRNWRNSVKYCTKLDTRIDGPWSNVPGLQWRKSLVDPLRGVELYGWQKDIVDLMKKDIDFRTVHWYWEPNGCAGKTSLARHMRIKYGSKVLYVNGLSRDILCSFAKQLDEGIDIELIFFGLTRQDMNKVSYKSLEIFKDGIGFSGKYESASLCFNPPHVVVFANFPPDNRCLSEDRWNIVDIRSVPLPPQQAVEDRSGVLPS